jgi:nucleotide-binding universal stress UspA family protein
MIKLDRILAPTDFSDHSGQAVQYACELAKRFGAELRLLHVVQPPSSVIAYGAPVPEEVLHPQSEAQKELESLEVPDAEQIRQVVREIQSGPPFVEIVRYAKANDVDLIVMGTHGRTGIVHALLGSVAEKVVRKAPCPVLTVRTKGHQFVMP